MSNVIVSGIVFILMRNRIIMAAKNATHSARRPVPPLGEYKHFMNRAFLNAGYRAS